MSSESIQMERLQDDVLITTERQKCDKPGKLFGDIAIGANKIILPQKYLEHSTEILNLEVRPEDVWVISNPRSGTTWTEELVWLLSQNLDYETAISTDLHKRFRFLEGNKNKSMNKNSIKYFSEFFTFPPTIINRIVQLNNTIHKFFMFSTDITIKEFGDIDDLNACQSPRFIKTHLNFDLLPKQLWTVKPKIIFVFRNPKDVVISGYHFAKMSMIANYRGNFEDFAEIFLRDKYVYAPFWKQVLDFWKMRNRNILFLTYEEMKQDLITAIYKVANYLGVTLTSDAVTKLADHLDFSNMKENDAVNLFKQTVDSNFIREGTSQQWKTKMSQTLIEKFNEWSRKQIEGTDFPIHWAC